MAAVSDREGRGTLIGGAHSELGHLQRGQDIGTGESVTLVTLDACRARLGLRDIAFIKIDAEGAEAEIIEGGRRFFAEESPLVMFEVRPGETAIDTDLVARFERLGYRAYRLVPGLGLLAPVDGTRPLDPFTLNLFACRDDRARLLERRGLLARAAPADANDDEANRDDANRDDAPSGAWLAHLRAQLFAAPLWPRWSSWIAAAQAAPQDRNQDRNDDSVYARALDHYAIARHITEPPARRFAALMRALDLIRGCARERPTLAILQSCARIAGEAGERALAVQMLNQIVERCTRAGAILTDADADADADADGDLAFPCPFLAVSPRFDEIAPPANRGDRPLGHRGHARTARTPARILVFLHRE